MLLGSTPTTKTCSKPAAGQSHVGKPEQVGLGVSHSGDRADAVA